MKIHKWRGIFFVSVVLALAVGCSVRSIAPEFVLQDLNPKISQNIYQKRIDTFYIVFDASSSMDDRYGKHSKLTIAKEIVHRLNATIPRLDLQGAMRIFGPLSAAGENSELIYGITDYTKQALGVAVDKIALPGGMTPMEVGLKAAGSDLEKSAGRIALIVISDGKETKGNALQAVNELKSRFGERLCIYTVHVGGCPEGKKLLEKMAEESRCGFSVEADFILSGAGMSDFVEKVFLEKKHGPIDSDGDGVYDDRDNCPNTPKGTNVDANGCPPLMREGDRDGDGVADNRDKCPDTPTGARVDRNGCWHIEPIYFDSDKSYIKGSEYGKLDDLVAVMRQNSGLKIKIEGHTDNMADAAYNKILSEKRAVTVRLYLERMGINGERLVTSGFGYARPAAGNQTPEGRSRNRRVEMYVIH